MKIRLKIRHKIQIYILLTTIAIYAGALGYISIKSKNMAYNDAKRISDNYAIGAASQVQIYLETYLTTAKDLSNAFKIYKEIDEKNRRQVLSQIMKKTLESNQDFLSVWSILETNSIDNLDNFYKNTVGSTVLGNFRYIYYKDGKQIRLSEYIEKDSAEVLSGRLYTRAKQYKKEIIEDPYYYSYTNNKATEVFEISICVPIVVDGQFLGVVGVDVQLAQFKEIINSVKPFENSIAFLMSNNGTYVANPDDQFTGKRAIDVFPAEVKEHKVMEHIARGLFLSYEVIGLDGSLYYDVYAPIQIGNTGTPWSIGIAVPIDQVMEKANRNFKISMLVGFFGLFILSLVIYFISNSITKPILKVTEFLTQLSEGKVDSKMQLKIRSGDEIEEMGNALNKSIVGLVEKTDFARDIGNGNLNTNIHLLSDEDILGKSLIEMRNNLRTAHDEEEKRKAEDEKRRWFNEGLALFSDVLRQNNNIKDLSYAIIQNLINYLKANQGGLFIINDEKKDDIYFDLLASYAFNRRKYKEKQIKIGEGLTGTCAQEKKTVYLTNLPQNYIQITSGLGGSNPRCLLIVPLMIEENVLGLIEIASFNEIASHEIEFVEKIGQNIASTLMSVRINEQTAKLLKQSQQQSEMLSSQEEEMRQNMEELQATQEEAARKTAEMEGFINALHSTSFVVEYNPEGYVISANNAILNLFGISREEIIGMHHSEHLDFTADQKTRYNEFWSDLQSGMVKKEKTKITINGKSYLLMESYTPIYGEDGQIIKILKIANDISEYL